MTRGELSVIRKTVSVLDSVDYGHYSQGTARSYPEYASGDWTDERILISPILFPRLLEQVLGFSLGETIGTQEPGPHSADIPDYIPVDTRTHPFVFDCKGMDTLDLSTWYAQIRRYMATHDLQYGILTNMRDLAVYTTESAHPIEGLSCSILKLRKDFTDDPQACLERENTQRFLRAVESFGYTPLTLSQKLERVCKAKRWTGSETLWIDLLTQRLRYVVQRISEDASSRRQVLYSLGDSDPDRARDIAQEIGMIAAEIDPGVRLEEATLDGFHEILSASGATTVARALGLYFQRVGYFTMTRLLLVRAWEDIGFIDQTLYDGGLAKWYDNFNREIRWVLKHAFDLAAERYRWLFNVENNYVWYEPSNETLAEVLYELSNFYLGNLDQDILGTIYEEYIDRVDKRRKGQYYTPREIVEFIWDRVGFVRDSDFFRYEGGERSARLIFDPAAGSGGFLVEAARRIREDSGIDYDDFRDVLDLRTSILTGVFGSEISVFPYYICEVNLLIQLTPVIKRMMDMRKGFTARGTPALAVLPVDALSLYNSEQLLLEKEQYDFDRATNLLPLERQKQLIFRKIKTDLDGQFSYCCANPPYVGEKGNKELFRTTLERLPYWRPFYQGRMDYFYFFVILGLSKLEQGGRLGFITTAYWPTADGASKLREYILKNAKVREMVFFEDLTIFEYAKGQHNMVFVLEKCSGEERAGERDTNRLKIVRMIARQQDIPGDTIRGKLRFITQRIQEHVDADTWEDEYLSVFWGGVAQGGLPKNGGSWHDALARESPIKCSDVVVPLGDVMEIRQGIVPNPDRTTPRNMTLLPAATDVEPDEGVFVLSEAEVAALGLTEPERTLVKESYRNSDICRYVVDIPEETRISLIYLTQHHDLDEYPSIARHLTRYRPILERRREVEEGKMPWYSLHWPRDEGIFQSPKIVCSNWGNDWQPFAFQEAGFYERRDITLLARKHGVHESLLYFLGLLNSQLLFEWVSDRLRQRGYMRQKLQQAIPVRRISFDSPEDVTLHDEIVVKVKEIRETIGALAAYSRYYAGLRLARTTVDDPLPPPDAEAIVGSLAPEDRYSVRTHPNIQVTVGSTAQERDFLLETVGQVSLTLEGPQLKLTGRDGTALFVTADHDLLEIIAGILEGHRSEPWSSVKDEPLLPRDAPHFHERKQSITDRVAHLRGQIQQLQHSIDRRVFRLYAVHQSGE